eukprot:9413333-Alexandrium_andersonii.AAC.1
MQRSTASHMNSPFRAFPEAELVVLRTPCQEARKPAYFRARVEWRAHRRGEVEPPGCWERAGTKRKPSPNTLEARIRPSR